MIAASRLMPAALSVLVLLSAGHLSAATKDQQSCINANNKNFQKLTAAIGKDIDGCIKDNAKGQLGTTPAQCFGSDGKGKIAKAMAKADSDFAKRCVGDDKNGVSKLPSFGVTDPNTLGTVAAAKELALVGLLFGSDVDSALIQEATNKDASKCQQSIAKTLKKCQDTQLKEFNKCKKTALKAGANGFEGCVLDDPKGKIAKACDQSGGKVDKIRSDLNKKCAAVPLATAFPGCAESDVEGLHACLTTQLNCLTCMALNDADALQRECDIVDDGIDNESCQGGIPTAEAAEITDPSDLIGGLLARGRLGDFLLENEKIRIIVQKPGRDFSAGVGQYGGNVIDADLQRGEGEPGHDLFEEWSVLINVENTANYTSVFVLNDGSDGNAAVVRATGPDDLLDFINPSTTVTEFGFPFPSDLDDTDQPVDITTDYILERQENALRIETTVTNTSGSDIDLFLGDFLSSLAQEVFEPGYGFGQPLVTTSHVCATELPCDFLAYSQGGAEKGGVSYAYIHTTDGSTIFTTDGVQVSILGVQILQVLIGLASPNFTVPAGESVTVTRYLAIGDGDVASVLDTRNRLKGLDTGVIQGQVTLDGAPVEDAEIAVIGPFLSGPGTTVNVVSQFRTDPNGNYEGTLPPADYELRVNKDGHLFGAPDPALISLGSGAVVTQDFTMTAPATVDLSIVDPNGGPIAGRVSVVGFDPSSDPGSTQSILGLVNNVTGVFGDITKDPRSHGLARELFVDPNGSLGFDLEPGDYRVVVSHGTEYSIYQEDISAVSGLVNDVNADVAPVVDTTGFVSGDFHVHSFDSVDCPVTREERIISMIAEGVDFFTPSDHGFRIDFTQDIADLGVADLISTAVGNEITSFDYGHFGAFPMTVDPNRVSGGSIDWGGAAPPGEDFPSLGAFSLSPGEIYDAVAADPGEEMMQIHHVHSFFDAGLKIDTGVVPPQSFGDPATLRLDPSVTNFWDEDFNALEVWIETQRSQDLGNFLGENAGNWFNLLNQGSGHTGTADSDTHQLSVVRSGFPRNMIASPTDDPGALAAIAETLAVNVNEGRSLGTNGPFMRLTLEGDPGETGGLELGMPTLVKATGGAATLTVEIQSPTWAEFDTVEYYVNSETIKDPNDRDGLPPLYRICPDFVEVDGVDFSISTVAVGSKARLEATSTLSLSGLAGDAWVVVMVKGTDGVSCPLFPVVSNDLNPDTNATLADLKSCDLGGPELGTTALAFSNPLFIDVNDNGFFDPPGPQFQISCP
jgi:hypothetical protein